MDEANRLSLLALIIAIVALIVSAWQLVQQLFATATDGKRYCQASVIGIWARKTRLSWRWGQIRFETKYTTPEIRLYSGISDEVEASAGDRSTTRPLRLINWFPGFTFLSEVLNGPPSDWNRYFEVTSNRTDIPLEMRKTTWPHNHVTSISKAEALSWWRIKNWDHSFSEASPDVVSWPILLRLIYRNQIKSIRKVERAPSANGVSVDVDIKQLEEDGTTPSEDIACPDMTSEESRYGEDRVVVRLVERSWDLIPPDVVRWVLTTDHTSSAAQLILSRPLARSNVGTIVVIAHRFGMSWLGEFNPSEGKMNAAGSGHTISSETVRGLGTILQYTHHSESKAIKNLSGSRRGLSATNYLSPTVTTDKLHCGYLPIDDAAVHRRDMGEHIHLIDVTRKLDLHAFLNRLDVPSADMDKLRDKKDHNPFGSPGRGLKHALEEAISLLCPIPVLPDSNARWIVWPFRSFRQPYTPFRQKEGIQELRDQLYEYIKADKPGASIMNNRNSSSIKFLTKSPLEHLDFLLAAYKPLRQNRMAPTAASKQSACELYRQILDIHKETSNVFAEMSNAHQTDDEEALPFLIDMAAAQIVLAVKHGRDADDIAMADGAQENLSEADTRPRFVKELARLYVEDLHDSQERTIRKHLKRRGYLDKLGHGEAPALWWTAVVRSVCWFVSVQIRLPEG